MLIPIYTRAIDKQELRNTTVFCCTLLPTPSLCVADDPLSLITFALETPVLKSTAPHLSNPTHHPLYLLPQNPHHLYVHPHAAPPTQQEPC